MSIDIFDLPSELMIIVFVNMFLTLILFIINFATRSKLKKIKSKYQKFMNGLSDRNIEQLLESCIQDVNDVSNKNKQLENQMNQIERDILKCIQKIGIVRFNAFENVGSDQSFSLALLDDGDSGLVISGIYSRDSSSTFAKPVVSGKSKYALSAEEIQAIDIAKKSNREKQYLQ